MTAAPELRLHSLRKIEIIVRAEDRLIVEESLRSADVGGWTMIRDVAGLGHSGFHEGRRMFNDQSGLLMFIGVSSPDIIAEVAKAMGALFERMPGVMFLSDVEVLRSHYFVRAGE